MRSHLRSALAVLVLAAAAAPASAATVMVPIDQSTRLNVNGQAASVLVGNPAVADVTVIDSRTLFISGRGYGTTDVVVLDAEGRTLFSGELVVGASSVGRVSVYRGPARTDLACAPNCQVANRAAGAAPAAAAAPTANPLSAAMNAITGGRTP